MLEGLENIKWNKLETSYSQPATEVPKYIRGLLSDSAEDRQKSWKHLSHLICDTNVVNTATLATIPFLWELLQADETKDKIFALWILQSSSQSLDVDEHDKGSWKCITGKVGLEIARGIDLYIQLLEHSDWEVRLGSIALLMNGVFPKSDWNRIHTAYKDLKIIETHPKIQQHFENWDDDLIRSKPVDENTFNE